MDLVVVHCRLLWTLPPGWSPHWAIAMFAAHCVVHGMTSAPTTHVLCCVSHVTHVIHTHLHVTLAMPVTPGGHHVTPVTLATFVVPPLAPAPVEATVHSALLVPRAHESTLLMKEKTSKITVPLQWKHSTMNYKTVTRIFDRGH